MCETKIHEIHDGIGNMIEAIVKTGWCKDHELCTDQSLISPDDNYFNTLLAVVSCRFNCECLWHTIVARQPMGF